MYARSNTSLYLGSPGTLTLGVGIMIILVWKDVER